MALAGDDCQHQELGRRAPREQGVQRAGQPLPWGRHLPGQPALCPSPCQEQGCGYQGGLGGCV